MLGGNAISMREFVNLSDVRKAWPFSGPWVLTPLQGGTNNRVWRVETDDGQRFVLHVYPDAAAIPRIRYENDLLQTLSTFLLPFHLPLPVKTTTAEIFAQLMDSPGVAV